MKSKLIIFVFIIFSVTLCSQNIEKSADKLLSLEDCIKIGLSNNKSLISASSRIAGMNAKYAETKTNKLPQVKFTGSYSRLSDVPPFEVSMPAPISKTFQISPSLLNSYNFRIGLQQPIFTGFKIQSAQDIAEYSSLSSTEEYNSNRNDLIFNIKSAYFNILRIQSILSLFNENIKQIESHIKDSKDFYEKGLLNKDDILKTEVQLLNIKVNFLESENYLKISKLNLCNLLGINLSPDISIADIILSGKANYGQIDTYIQEALSNRSELKSMEYKVRIAESGVISARSNWFPQIFLSANFLYANPNQRIMPAKDEFKGTWDAGVSLSFDIWNWGANSAKVDQANSQLDEVKISFSQLRDGIILDVNQSYLTIIQLKEKINYTEKSVEQAEESFRISQQRFSKGLLSNSEMIDAETMLFQAKTNNIQALIDFQIALARLEKAIGKK